MPILARFMNFLDFVDFRKAVATACFGISKIPTTDFDIHSFSCHLLKIFCFLVTQICAMGSWIQKYFWPMLIRYAMRGK